jgi:hypothetical protein
MSSVVFALGCMEERRGVGHGASRTRCESRFFDRISEWISQWCQLVAEIQPRPIFGRAISARRLDIGFKAS